MLRVTLTRGLVGKKDIHKKVIQALGLRKFGSSVVHNDTPIIRGMVNKVHYLVTVTEEKAGTAVTAKAKPARAAKPVKAPAAAAPKAAPKAEAKKPAAKETKAAAKPAAKAAK